MEDTQKKPKKKKRSVEQFIKRYHFRLELIRTIVPCCVLILQILIFIKLFDLI